MNKNQLRANLAGLWAVIMASETRNEPQPKVPGHSRPWMELAEWHRRSRRRWSMSLVLSLTVFLCVAAAVSSDSREEHYAPAGWWLLAIMEVAAPVVWVTVSAFFYGVQRRKENACRQRIATFTQLQTCLDAAGEDFALREALNRELTKAIGETLPGK